MAEPKPTRIRLVVLKESVTLAGMELTSIAPPSAAALTANQAHIVPAVLDGELAPRPIEKGQRCDGLYVWKAYRGGVSGAFIPWAAVKSISYGE